MNLHRPRLACFSLFLNLELFCRNNKTIIEFGFPRIWRILQIEEEGAIHRGRRRSTWQGSLCPWNSRLTGAFGKSKNLINGFYGLFTWSGGPGSSGVGFFCFHALGDTKQKKPTPLDRGPPLHVNRVLTSKTLITLHVHGDTRFSVGFLCRCCSANPRNFKT